MGWPARVGGRGLPLNQQVIYFEEYARAGGPGRLGHIGEGLIGPTLIHFGSPEQQGRFLPAISPGPGALVPGLLRARRRIRSGQHARPERSGHRREGRDEWVIDGQKVWTSLAHWSDWCFVLARTDREAPKHRGISFLLIRMDSPGIEIRPIVQLTGTSEFNEVFFAGARTPAELVVGDVNGGWKVAMGLLSFERGASTLGQQFGFERELGEITDLARANGRADDPAFRQRLADGVESPARSCAANSLRMLTHADEPQLSGASLHRQALLGPVRTGTWASCAMDVLGPDGHRRCTDALRPVRGPAPVPFTRADTIYGGSDQIQRNIIGERALGLPPEPRPT